MEVYEAARMPSVCHKSLSFYFSFIHWHERLTDVKSNLVGNEWKNEKNGFMHPTPKVLDLSPLPLFIEAKQI